MQAPDIIVVGLGTVGSATCMMLARRGLSVLGLDALRPPHNRSSHHGESRSIRRAYLEGSTYVPLALGVGRSHPNAYLSTGQPRRRKRISNWAPSR